MCAVCAHVSQLVSGTSKPSASVVPHRAGETVALVGESGSGKSVTALSILGLLESTGRIAAGSIEFSGASCRASRGQLRAVRGREIAMIFQDPATSLDPCTRSGTSSSRR